MTDTQPIRPAATIVLTRGGPSGPEVLMGQRGHGAAFMPSKFVFPGGAVDPDDSRVPLGKTLSQICTTRLHQADGPAPETLAAAAIRELFEETGLALGHLGNWAEAIPNDWQSFAARGVCPDASGLQFVFRAITPPGRTRRFDARFFLADAATVAGDTNDFSAASDELSHLHWISLAQTRQLDLPFITEVVLSEVGRLLLNGPSPAGVPFFDNSGPVPTFRWLT